MPVADFADVDEGNPFADEGNGDFTVDVMLQDQVLAMAIPPAKPSKPIVGIIYPPPEVRNIVDKTASFVARNGPEFEARIRNNEQNNSKFNFLNPGDPYNAYYHFKVKEFQEGKDSKPPGIQDLSSALSTKTAAMMIDEAKKKKQSELLKQVELPFVPKETPAEFEFVADPPSISAIDLDIVKLTAQFVARNGRQFLSSLMTREQRNYQFDFLRPQHSLFQYFTKLLEQYTKVLIPPKDIVKRLSAEDRRKVLEDVKYRANWIKHIEAQRRREEEEIEKERLAYACIDWHDFVVVETVDYQPFETGNFPPPTTPQEVGARVLLQDRILSGQMDSGAVVDEGYGAQDDTEVQDMEEDSSSSEDEGERSQDKPKEKKAAETLPASHAPPSFEPPRQGEVIIKKDYDPKQAKGPAKQMLRPLGPEDYVISPITGERIPASKIHEHVRIGLLDPRWKGERDRQMMEKANQESVYAPGVAIDESLKQLAERRSDIFGTGVEETPIGRKHGEEERLAGLAAASGPQPPASMDDHFEERDHIGPAVDTTVISAAPQPSQIQSGAVVSSGPQPATVSAPPMPPSSSGPLPGIVRPVQVPPQGMMFMQGIPGQMRPLLGIPQPGFPPFGVAPPGGMPRPPLINPIPGHPGMPMMPGMMPPIPEPQEEEPLSKKAKSAEDALIPEPQFLQTNGPNSTFSIALPSVLDKPELNLNGQLISFSMALTDSISTLKSKINEVIGLGPGKQKLSRDGLFFKDQNTLAYYNIGDGAVIHLSLKERGGRKK